MSDHRTHHVTTTDGVTIVGTVHGRGPTLVLVQGIIGDGDLDWQPLLPYLTGQFTCHLPSMRGRGLSGDHPDLGLGRQVEDLIAYVDSIGGAAALVGWSAGGGRALVAAAQSAAVSGVAAVEPLVMSLLDDRDRSVVGASVAHAAELAAAGELPAAARAFAGFPFTPEDVSAADRAGYFEAAGPYVPNLLGTLQQWLAYQGPTIDDPAVLGAVSVPVLVLIGSDTKRLSTASAQHVARHVPDAHVREVLGAGHAAPLTHPESLAGALVQFFSRASQPV